MLARLAAASQAGLRRVMGLWLLVGCAPIAVEAFERTDAGVSSPSVDECPDDPQKTQVGDCGCGVPDDDFDADGASDCVEACPDNADRTEPMGPCGCSSFADVVACTELRGALRNLYTFGVPGMTVVDSLGGQNGTLLHTIDATPLTSLERLQVNGRLNLDGLGSYVDLPDGLISSLGDATFEVWLEWRGGNFWARIFDFGISDVSVPVAEHSYLFLTPANSLTGTMRVAYSVAGPGDAETLADALSALPVSTGAVGSVPEHVAVVIDETAGAMRLYSDGVEVRSVAFSGTLAAIDDRNNWLGRSNYQVDPAFLGSLLEFRIYARALTAEQVSNSFRAGPGALDE